MTRKLIALVAVIGLMSVAAVASAAPANTRNNDSIGANMQEDGLFDAGFFWHGENQPPGVADLNFQVWDEVNETWCGTGINIGGNSWSDNGSVLTIDVANVELGCDDGVTTNTVTLHATWTYSGKWGPSHYSEQGLQCKSKLLRDDSPSVDYIVTGDLIVAEGDGFGAFGAYNQRDGYCNDTGKPGNPHDA